jgi:conjugal transfer pilus assembly protein TraV
MKRLPSFICLATSLGLAACGSLSGYDAKDSFSCKAPDGILCESMSGIYSNAQQNNLPGQRVHHSSNPESTPEAAADASDKTTAPVLSKPIYSGTPIRTAPRILRVWFAPWEDSDGDLHDQSYIYLPVDTGRWLIEHNTRRIQDNFRPARPPAKTQEESIDTDVKAATSPTPKPEGIQQPSQLSQDMIQSFLPAK